MKKNLNDFKRLLLTACCTLVLSCGWATVNEKPFVIPELKQWSGAEGMFTPSGKYVVKGGKNAQDVAKLFAADYHDLVGRPLTPKTGNPLPATSCWCSSLIGNQPDCSARKAIASPSAT